MATVEEIAKRLNKEFKMDNLIVRGDLMPQYDRLPTAALGMDYPLFGGLPLGRICVYSGLPHSGKTTAACCELAAYQKKFPNKTCVYIDAEHSLDMDFQVRMNHIDRKKLQYFSVPAGMSGEQVCELIVSLQKESDNIGLIVLDSLPALIPAIILENDLTKDAGIRSSMAKKFYPFLNEMHGLLAEKQNILICINQVRDDGKTFTGIQKWKETGGGAPNFYSSVSVRFGTRKFTLGDNMDACGAANGEGADGFRLQFKIMKNKTAPSNRGGGFITYRLDTGIDSINDMLEIALAFGFIERLNNVKYRLVNLKTGEVYTDKDGEPLEGKKDELIKYIKENKDFQDKYFKMLNDHISNNDKSYGTLLTKEASKEIDEQEEAVSNENKDTKKDNK